MIYHTPIETVCSEAAHLDRSLKLPKIETRPEQVHVGKRGIMPMSDLECKVPEPAAKGAEWLAPIWQ